MRKTKRESEKQQKRHHLEIFNMISYQKSYFLSETTEARR